MQIRLATSQDAAAVLSIIEQVIRAGETYALDSNMTQDQIVSYWLGSDKETFIVEEDGRILGTYYIRTNQSGGGRHVCNCGYMTASYATGRGVARKMCEHSLDHARSKGYLAMQFNFVVSTNTRAISLWQFCGFEIVGRLPGAFLHPQDGYVDALVLYQKL